VGTISSAGAGPDRRDVATAPNAVVFLAVLVPATSRLGVSGYGVAFAAQTLLQIGVRTLYMRRLFPDFAIVRHTARAVAPGVAVVLVARLLAGGRESLVLTLGELVAYAAVVIASTFVAERRLVAELVGYLRRGAGPAGGAAVAGSS